MTAKPLETAPRAAYLRTRQVATELNCSATTVRMLEKSGQLKAKIGPNGERRFKPSEVIALARRRALISAATTPGVLDAQLSRLFREGRRDCGGIAEELNVTFDYVHARYLLWKTPLGEAVVQPTPAPTAAEIRDREQREAEEHDARMRELDRVDSERRRRDEAEDRRRAAREEDD